MNVSHLSNWCENDMTLVWMNEKPEPIDGKTTPVSHKYTRASHVSRTNTYLNDRLHSIYSTRIVFYKLYILLNITVVGIKWRKDLFMSSNVIPNTMFNIIRVRVYTISSLFQSLNEYYRKFYRMRLKWCSEAVEMMPFMHVVRSQVALWAV